MTPESTCQEVFRTLLSPYLSAPTLEGIESNLGPTSNISFSLLDPMMAAALRRRLVRIGRSYLDPMSSATMLRHFDKLLSDSDISIPSADPDASGVFWAITPESIPSAEIIAKTQLLDSTPSGPRGGLTPHPLPPLHTEKLVQREPLRFSFRQENDLQQILPEVSQVLVEYLGDETVAKRLEVGFLRAAKRTLRKGGGEIRLELDSGIRGRLVFKITGTDQQIKLSGAALSTQPR